MMIPYLGEKSKYSDFIIPHIPEKISTYVEPFSGMFGIYFCLDLEKYTDTKFVYNDINQFNYNLFKYLSEPMFIHHLENIKVDHKYYEKAKKEIYNSSNSDKAVYWLVILTCGKSHVNILNNEWKGDYDFEILKLKIKSNQNYFSRINFVNNLDYKDVISKYDSEDTFFYIDPPFYGKEFYYINHDFDTSKKHEDLSNILKNVKGKFILSYLQFPELEKWYSGFRFDSFQTFMGKELLIMNY